MADKPTSKSVSDAQAAKIEDASAAAQSSQQDDDDIFLQELSTSRETADLKQNADVLFPGLVGFARDDAFDDAGSLGVETAELDETGDADPNDAETTLERGASEADAASESSSRSSAGLTDSDAEADTENEPSALGTLEYGASSGEPVELTTPDDIAMDPPARPSAERAPIEAGPAVETADAAPSSGRMDEVEPNAAPTSPEALGPGRITEHAPEGMVVARLRSEDAEGDAISYMLTDAAGNAVAPGAFAIVGSAVVVNDPSQIDFEAGPATQTIYVKALDAFGESAPTPISLSIIDVAEAVTLADGGAVLADRGVAEISISGGSGADDITAHADGGDLRGGAGDDMLSGAAGDDTLTGGADDDAIDGGEGVDVAVFSGAWSEYTITSDGAPTPTYTIAHKNGGADGTDTVTNVETFRFSDGDVAAADLLNAGPSIDAASAATFAENVDGATVGTVSVSDANAGDAVSLSVDDARFEFDGTSLKLKDDASLSFEDGPVTLSITATDAHGATDVQTLEIRPDDVAEDLTISGTFVDTGVAEAILRGSSGADDFTGTEQGDIFTGNGGDDVLRGEGGDDRMEGGSGADTLYGGAGNDRMAGYDADSIFNGDMGARSDDGSNDRLFGGAGDDDMHGGLGDDLLDGGADNDTLTGGRGDDTIDGGAGSGDVAEFSGDFAEYAFSYNDATETITVVGPDGTDTVTGVETFTFDDQSVSILQGGAAGVLWSETFDGLSNGTKVDTGDSAWSVDDSATRVQSFGVVDGAFQGGRTTTHANADGEFAVLQTETISSSAFDAVTVSFEIESDGAMETSGRWTDFFRVYAVSDGERTLIHQDYGDIDGDGLISVTGVEAGESFALEFEFKTTADSEYYTLDNISITGEPVVGGAGADIFAGDASDQGAHGGAGDDVFFAGGGNDTLTGGAGDDALDGGEGAADVAVFTGAQTDYTITENGGVYTLVDNRTDAPDGTDTVENVEIFRFADGDVAAADLNIFEPIVPVVHYTFDEAGDREAFDHCQNGRHGVYQGDADNDGAREGGATALSLDGSGDYVEIAPNSAYQMSEGAVSMWFNAADLDGRQTLISRDSRSLDGGGHFRIALEGDGSVSVRIQSDSQSRTFATDADLVSAGEWTHVTATFGPDGATIYVNGVEEATNSWTGGTAGNDEPWTIGADQRVSGDGVANNLRHHFEGQVDDFVVYDQQLSADQVSTLHDQGVEGLGGGASSDQPDYDDGSGPIAATHQGGAGEDDYKLEAGDQVVYGGAGDDKIDAGSGDDTVYGGSGADVIDGEDNADTLFGGSGDDTVLGGAGADTLYGDAGADEIDAGDDDDIAFGGTGDDDIDGGAGADTLYGDAGDDVLTGGAGDDVMFGGAGSDDFLIGDGDGLDSVVGGIGWTDSIQLEGVGGSEVSSTATSFDAGPWSVTLTSGSIQSKSETELVFSEDASGSISFDDGQQVDFAQVETLNWN